MTAPMKRALILIAAAAAVSACAASQAQVREAREAAYQTEFATVWNAIAAEMNEKFKDAIKVEDATAGYIESKWKPVNLQQDSYEGDMNIKADKYASAVGARDMFRALARIEPGGPPWKIVVDGEAARYQPGMSVLTPYRRGAIDEPAWVSGRIEGIRLEIHERLKQYAVKSPAQKTP
jgi:hypothetical protein